MKNIPNNSRRDQTRLRILHKADELFHRLGFYKTTVADIARELEMSPANIYKFFSSKEALVQAVAEWNLSLFQEAIGEALKGGKSSSAKLKILATTIYQFHKNKFRSDHEMYRLMVAAHDEHLEASIEAEVLFDSLTWIINPLLMFELKNAQVTKRIDAQIRFFERALT